MMTNDNCWWWLLIIDVENDGLWRYRLSKTWSSFHEIYSYKFESPHNWIIYIYIITYQKPHRVFSLLPSSTSPPHWPHPPSRPEDHRMNSPVTRLANWAARELDGAPRGEAEAPSETTSAQRCGSVKVEGGMDACHPVLGKVRIFEGRLIPKDPYPSLE